MNLAWNDQGKLLKTGDDAKFFGGTQGGFFDAGTSLPDGIEFGADKPRIYKGANLQLDVVFNKLGYHYPQQRILTLWEDVGDLMDKKRPPEPLVLRMNTFDCAMYAHTNLVPHFFFADDYQITTPTDVIGQHIHLPKWDLTAADGSANGWNYEDGTFSPGMVRERIHAINAWNTKHPGNSIPNPYNGTDDPLKPFLHPYFNGTSAADSICDENDDCPYQAADCEASWESVDGDSHKFEVKYGMPRACDWLGARTTLQRWFSDPLVNRDHVHRGLGTTFTHDHLGPSTHQQLGLYATMLSEPPGSEWRHNETGDLLYDTAIRQDGGPTSWQATITGKNAGCMDVDGNGKGSCQPATDDSHREFFLQFGDFQHAYVEQAYYGVDQNGYAWMWDPDQTAKPTPGSFRDAINPSFRKPATPVFPDIIAFEPYCPGGQEAKGLPGSVYSSVTDFSTGSYDASGRPVRPCAEAISADDIGMMVVNYRNEPVGARVYDRSLKRQSQGIAGDLAYAMQTLNNRKIPELNTALGNTPYPPLTSHINDGDPFTPIMRAYSGDLVRVKIQAGSHEHEHNGSINALGWLQGGSGFGQAPHSGWRNSQNTGLSEQFTFNVRITDYWSDTYLNDRMYAVDTSQDGLWNGVWGILRSKNKLDDEDMLVKLPSNDKPIVLSPYATGHSDNACPADAHVRQYEIVAVLANKALDNSLGVTIPTRQNSGASAPSSQLDSKGGTLVYNPRSTAISIEMEVDGKLQTQQFGSGPLHDPTAILFVRKNDLDSNGKLRTDAPLEPLVLRAAAGECIQIVLHNDLPKGRAKMPDLDGYTSHSGIIHRDVSSSGSVTTFNNNLIRPSNRIGLHPQLVHYNLQTYDGSIVGGNTDSTIGPGESIVYQWYAGVVELPPSPQACPEERNSLAEKYRLLSLFPILSKIQQGRPTRSPVKLMTEQAFQEIVYATLDPEYRETGELNEKIQNELRENIINLQRLTDIVRDTGFIVNPVNFNKRIKSIEISDINANTELADINSDALFRQISSGVKSGNLDELRRSADGAPLLGNSSYFDPIDNLGKNPLELLRSLTARFQEEGRLSRDLSERLASNLIYEFVEDFPQAYKWRIDFFERFDPQLSEDNIQLVQLSEKACRYVPVEFGGTDLTPPDRIKQGQKAAIGALVIEPERSFWIESIEDDAINRQNPGINQSNKRKTRATAIVFYPTNQDVRFFRDLVMVHQKGLNLRYKNGSAVPNLAAEKEHANEDPAQTAPEDAHDSGHMAINYGTEPLWFRFGLPPDAPFGWEGFGGAASAWQAFSNQCCDNRSPITGGTVISADPNIGEPYVPIMTAYAGQEMRIRALMPTGVGRGSTVELHGHYWARDPYLAGTPGGYPPSKCIGNNALAMNLGGQESVTPMGHFDLVFPRAGGARGVWTKASLNTGIIHRPRSGADYLWRDHAGFGITNGLWALIRVAPAPLPIPFAPNALRESCELS